MSEVSTWNAVDASNNAAPPDGWPEGQQPSSVNDCARMMMGALRREHDNIVAQIGSVAGTISTTTINATTVNTTGAITASGPITGSAINSTGNASVAGMLTAAGGITVSYINYNFSGSAGYSIGFDWGGANVRAYVAGNPSVLGVIPHALPISVAEGGTGATTGAPGPYLPISGGTVTGTVTAGFIHSTGAVDADGTVHAASGEMFMGPGGSGRQLQMASGWYWDFNPGTGDMIWGAGVGAPFWMMRFSDHTCGNQTGPVFGLGAYINFSDARGKTDIAPATQGLDEILKLSPITFKRAGQDRVELGFTAQDVRGILPEAVHPMDAGADPSLGVSLDPIVAALVNAVKELTQQVEALKQEKANV